MTSEPTAPATLRVYEIFTSIQGESSLAGWPCVFIRLCGCPLRCTYCDTAYARDADGEDFAVADLLEVVDRQGQRMVAITGGEPLMQPATAELVRRLADRGYQVVVETGGGVSIAGIDPRARIVLDVKTPGSGMVDRQDLHNLALLRPTDEVKFVITSREDYEWARDFVAHTALTDKQIVHFSPVTPPAGETPAVAAQTLAAWILEDHLQVRLNLQLHCWIWGAGARGV